MEESELWKHLGNYIRRNLQKKRAVNIPQLGTFTFTSQVSLEGVTNPTLGQKDTRSPVFLVSPDLAPGLQHGIQHSSGIRPFSTKGFGGRVPTSQINYTQIAVNSNTSKETVKSQLEKSIKSLSEQIKNNKEVRLQIPTVGSLVVKKPLVAVFFKNLNSVKNQAGFLSEDGAKWLRDEMEIDMQSEQNYSVKHSYRNLERPQSENRLFDSSSIAQQQSIRISVKPIDDIVYFIVDNKSKLILICQSKDQSNRGLLQSRVFFDCVKMLQNPKISETDLNRLLQQTGSIRSNQVRYKDFISGLQRLKNPVQKRPISAVSDATRNYNKTSVIPYARLIWNKKMQITQAAQAGGLRPRIPLTPSQLLSILKKSSVNLNIHQLKAILRQIGAYECSAIDLIKGVRILLTGTGQELSVFSQILTQSQRSRPVSRQVRNDSLDKIRTYLRDFSLPEIFRRACLGHQISSQDFCSYLVQQSNGQISEREAGEAFGAASRGKPKLSQIEFCKSFQSYQTPKMVQQRGFRKLKAWLKSQNLTSEQAFQQLKAISGATGNLSRQHWTRAMAQFDFSGQQADILFSAIDSKYDNVVDLSEWSNKVYQQGGPLQALRETLLQHTMKGGDLQETLNPGKKQQLSTEEMASALEKMDPNIERQTSIALAKAVSSRTGYVNMQDFMTQMAMPTSSGHQDWLTSILRDLQRQEINLIDLQQKFEEADQNNTGMIQLNIFQEILVESVNLSDLDIERLGRILDTGNHQIDYYHFLRRIQPSEDLRLKSLNDRLMVYIKQNGYSLATLLQKLGGRITIARFAQFIRSKIHQKLSREEVLDLVQKIDQNSDGLIDLKDLTSFISGDRNSKPYTLQSLNQEKAGKLIEDIREALRLKKMTVQSAFRNFDTEQNGLLSAAEFSEGIRKIMVLAQPLVDGLFALMDKQQIGLVDFDNFASVLQYKNIQEDLHQDSWNWESEALENIKNWILQQNLPVEDAFRAFDRDFDGIISREDLQTGLKAVLNLKDSEITPANLTRLYKLLDTYKRNSIQLSDFKLLFEQNRVPQWKQSAKQQLGLYISKNFQNLHESFQKVAGQNTKITLANFSRWLQQTQALQGFSLTPPLVQQLFASLDHDRKGFVSVKDWELAFTPFEYQDLCLQQLKDAIRMNFSNIQSAYDYFMSFRKQPPMKIGFKEFQQAVQSLVPKRYQKQELSRIWQSLAANQSLIDFRIFKGHFDDGRFLSKFSSSSTQSLQSRSATSALSSKSGSDPLKHLQSIIRASPYSLQEVFRGIDTDHSGTLSQQEFRAAMRKMNIGLTSRDIDFILARIDKNNDGQIDWAEFRSYFKTSQTQHHIKDVAQKKLDGLKSSMYAFMLSPKEAFRHFDSSRAGKMSFADFSSLIQKLSEFTKESVPPFTVIKDLFDIIDLRKDGLIDLREWLNTFKESQKHTWEDSKQYELVVQAIARNRKLIQNQLDERNVGGKVSFEMARDVIGRFIKEGLSVENWRRLLGVSCKDGMVDYRMLLDIYKEKAVSRQYHPKAQNINGKVLKENLWRLMYIF